MPIENEMMVRAIFVLANARFEERCFLHPGKAHRHMRPRFLDCYRRDRPLAGCRIERRSASVIRDLEAAPFITGNAVKKRGSVIDPGGQPFFAKSGIPWTSTKEEHLLARGC